MSPKPSQYIQIQNDQLFSHQQCWMLYDSVSHVVKSKTLQQKWQTKKVFQMRKSIKGKSLNQREIIWNIWSKYFMPFCLISGIIHPRWSWILPYRRWIILILNKNWHEIFVLLYTPSTKQKVDECSQGTEYSIDNITIFLFFLKKKNSTGITILNYLISIFVIIFLCEITQTLWIISKSIEFKLCHMKRTT